MLELFRGGALAAATLTTGLMAGLYYAYAISVMLGLSMTDDPTFVSKLFAWIQRHAPRGLDRNLAIAGRVIEGMELLSGLPRGPAPMGFYTDKRQRVSIESVRLAADLPPARRPQIEVLRTDSATFAKLVEAKRNRRDAFYAVPAGKIDLCSVAIPSREKK